MLNGSEDEGEADATSSAANGQLSEFYLSSHWGIGEGDTVVPFFGKRQSEVVDASSGSRKLVDADVTLICAVLLHHTSAAEIDLSNHDLTSESLETLSKHILQSRDNTLKELYFSHNSWATTLKEDGSMMGQSAGDYILDGIRELSVAVTREGGNVEVRVCESDEALKKCSLSYRCLFGLSLRSSSLRILRLSARRFAPLHCEYPDDSLRLSLTPLLLRSSQVLDLGSCRLGPAFDERLSPVRTLMDHFISAKGSTLRTLNLSNNDLGSKEAKFIIKAIETPGAMSSIKILDLGENPTLLYDDYAAFCEALVEDKSKGKHFSIEELGLANTGINRQASKKLSAIVHSCPTLRKLDLSKNRINDHGAKLWLDKLTGQNSDATGATSAIIELNLSECGLSAKNCLDHVNSLLSKNDVIKVLDMSRNEEYRVKNEGNVGAQGGSGEAEGLDPDFNRLSLFVSTLGGGNNDYEGEVRECEKRKTRQGARSDAGDSLRSSLRSV